MVVNVKAQYKFPSEAFFSDLAKLASATLADKKLGFADLKFGFEILSNNSTSRYLINFDGYEIKYEKEVKDFEKVDVEAYVTGQLSTRIAMFRNIKENSMATGPNTFNALTLAGFPLSIRGRDQVGADKVFRFAETIQHFLDCAHLTGDITE